LPLRGFEPLPVGEDLKMAGILMYCIILVVGKIFHHRHRLVCVTLSG